MRNIKIAVLVLTLSLLSFGAVSTKSAHALSIPSYAAADLKADANNGLDQVGGSGVTFEKVVSAAVVILSIIVGMAAVIMVIVSGMKYITSGGDSAKVSSAKTTLAYALIGLAVAALAQFLVHFVLNTAEGTQSCPSKPSVTVSSSECK
ncbi:MAG: pilin [Candidatus Saccharimonadales bacterium]